MADDDDDAQLVALIDGELDGRPRQALEARLAADAALRARLEQLRQGGRALAPALQTLIDAAPVERLKTSLAAAQAAAKTTPSRPNWTPRVRQIAAAAALVLFGAGLAVGRFWPTAGPPPSSSASLQAVDSEDWRQAVAEYTELYTADTLSAVGQSPRQELALVGAKLGMELTPERVALPELQFKGAQIFDFHGDPLGQVGYVDAATGPVFLCIVGNSAPDAAIESGRRGKYSVATWAQKGRSYMLIGRLPAERLAEAADSLQHRL